LARGRAVGAEAIRLAFEKKATDAVLIQMSEAVTFTDWFVVLTGGNPRQTKAISDEIQRGLREQGVRATRAEGEREGDWILLDYLDVVVHVFTPDAREFYRLEKLWGDVPQTWFSDEGNPGAGDEGILGQEARG
jgi:ribosome-associated protein